MIEVETFGDWINQCLALGLAGPYSMPSDHLSQFIGINGTAAIWNFTRDKGYIFIMERKLNG